MLTEQAFHAKVRELQQQQGILWSQHWDACLVAQFHPQIEEYVRPDGRIIRGCARCGVTIFAPGDLVRIDDPENTDVWQVTTGNLFSVWPNGIPHEELYCVLVFPERIVPPTQSLNLYRLSHIARDQEQWFALPRQSMEGSGDKAREDSSIRKMTKAQTGDVLAVPLGTGGEALVQAHVPPTVFGGGYDSNYVRVDVLKPTGDFQQFYYISPLGTPIFTFEYTFPVIPGPDMSEEEPNRSLTMFRILSWEELQPLTIIPLYRDLDAKNGAAYALRDYEADRGVVVAAKNCLRDNGYEVNVATQMQEGSTVFRAIFYDHFHVRRRGQRKGEIWTCQELVARAMQLRGAE